MPCPSSILRTGLGRLLGPTRMPNLVVRVREAGRSRAAADWTRLDLLWGT
jgi:hypothetical protein